MGNPLQDRRPVAELASAEQVIEITDEIGSFERLASIVDADLAALDPEKRPADWRASDISGGLQFGFADHERQLPCVTGSANTRVAAVCQRCLEPFQLQLSIEPKLLLLTSDQVAEGYDEYEVWELEEDTIRALDIVEELLVMALPFAAMHDNSKECRALESDDDDSVEDLVKPFAALRAQMSQNEKDLDE